MPLRSFRTSAMSCSRDIESRSLSIFSSSRRVLDPQRNLVVLPVNVCQRCLIQSRLAKAVVPSVFFGEKVSASNMEVMGEALGPTGLRAPRFAGGWLVKSKWTLCRASLDAALRCCCRWSPQSRLSAFQRPLATLYAVASLARPPGVIRSPGNATATPAGIAAEITGQPPRLAERWPPLLLRAALPSAPRSAAIGHSRRRSPARSRCCHPAGFQSKVRHFLRHFLPASLNFPTNPQLVQFPPPQEPDASNRSSNSDKPVKKSSIGVLSPRLILNRAESRLRDLPAVGSGGLYVERKSA